MNQKLTDAEKELMDILWEKEKAFMKDLIDAFPEQKPATTTIATLLKRMQNKNLVGYKTFGNSREYFPKIEKGKYFTGEMKGLIDKFFNNSVTQFASFFTANAKLSQKELEEIKKIIESELDKKQK
ncbi:BlaI/MecI/CopY family transcriptional regulator [Chryseobacterium suipulveris]|uniref:BlaI/MecI/CopY family transcriptional regulator n=1 Tax=Chryseobacterium suipulveris TaxID=2929800 RepID=A0ABY4BP66_9FLAO|nr:BlaI/MecI/CopY family transcriptional regulator [Chryseobacterium suipulveris]UOE40971.1 BlaI/MecI/CopY family transcriptional regulator [Chryseobacterium suipulveris]